MSSDNKKVLDLFEQCLKEYCSLYLSENKSLDDLAITIPFATLLLKNTMIYDDPATIIERTKKEYEIVHGE